MVTGLEGKREGREAAGCLGQGKSGNDSHREPLGSVLGRGEGQRNARKIGGGFIWALV